MKKIIYKKGVYLPFTALVSAIALAIATPVVAATVDALDPVFVTAKGGALDLKDVPASVTVITAEQIKQTPARNIADVIRLTTGISIAGTGMNRQVINIRGMESRHTLILIDGRRVNASDNVIGHSDFENSWIPLEAIERIEIVRGPLSSLYGSDAMGGTINIITKEAQDKWRHKVSVMAGKRTDDRGGAEKSIALTSTGPITDQLGLSFTVELADQEATPEKDSPNLSEAEGKNLKSLRFSLDYEINQQHSVELSHSRAYEERDRDTRSRVRPPATPVYHQSTQEIERIMTSLEHKGTFDAIDTSLRIYESSIDSSNTRTLGQRPNTPQKLIDRIVDGSVNMPMGERHFLTFGAELRDETLEHRMVRGGTETLSNQAVFVQNQIDLTENTLLTLGIRADDPEMFATEYSPRVYLIHHLNEQFSIKGGYGEGFKAPTIKEISPHYRFTRPAHNFVGNPNVRPESSNTAEIGVQYSSQNMSGGLTLFRTNVKDLMAWETLSVVGRTRTMHRVNVEGTTLIEGAEMELSANLPAGFNTKINLTKLDTENLTTGLSLLQRPDMTANLRLGWTSPDNTLTGGVSVQHIGEQESTTWVGRTSTRVTLPSYNLLGLNLQKSLNNNLTLRTGVENLADVRLADQHNDYGFEVRGRFIYAGAEFSF